MMHRKLEDSNHNYEINRIPGSNNYVCKRSTTISSFAIIVLRFGKIPTRGRGTFTGIRIPGPRNGWRRQSPDARRWTWGWTTPSRWWGNTARFPWRKLPKSWRQGRVAPTSIRVGKSGLCSYRLQMFHTNTLWRSTG